MPDVSMRVRRPDLLSSLLLINIFSRLKESNTAGDGENCDRCDAIMDQAKRRKSGGDGSNAHLPPMSSKIRMILKLLRDIEIREEGEKTIIFSQFTSMLDIIEPFLKAEGLRYVRCK